MGRFRPLVVALVVLVAAGALAPVATGAPVAPRADVVAGQVLVGLGPSIDAAGVAEVVHARRVAPLPFRPDVLLAEVQPGAEQRAIDALRADGRARWSAPNHIAHAAARPNDPLYGHQ